MSGDDGEQATLAEYDAAEPEADPAGAADRALPGVDGDAGELAEALADELADVVRDAPAPERMRERVATLEGAIVDLTERVDELDGDDGEGGESPDAPSRGFQ